ncbi:MAG: hypothetical protein HKN82_02670 [Akkermansiaceae bacterium]|nr:hypothetical protein [Akkermansiaceae bacterium]
MKAHILGFFAGLVMLLVLPGCLQIEQTIKLKKDGSGTLIDQVILGPQMVGMMEMAAAQGGGEGANPMADFFDEAKYKKNAGKYGEGVEFEKMEKVEKNGGKGVVVTYKFADINKVSFEPGSALDALQQPGQPDQAGEPAKFTFKDGKLTVDFPDPPENPEAGEAVEELDPQAAAMMQMFADMSLKAKLVMVDGIKKTNATHRDGDTITLMEVDFKKVIADPDGLSRLQKTQNKKRDEAMALLDGVDGVKFEKNDPLTVE